MAPPEFYVMARAKTITQRQSYNPVLMLRKLRARSTHKDEISWHEIFRHILSHRGLLAQANLLALLAMMTTVSLPLLLPLLVDEVVLNKPGFLVGFLNRFLPPEWQTALGYVAVITFISVSLRSVGAALEILQTRLFNNISKKIIYTIRTRILRYMRRVSMAEFETLGAGKIANHLTTDIQTMDLFMGQALSKFLIGLFSLIGAVAVMLWISPLLTLVLLLFNPFVALFTNYLGKYIKELKKKENNSMELFQLALTETFEAIQQIKVSNRERRFFNHLGFLALDVRTASAAFGWRSDAAERLSTYFFMFGFDFFRALAILLVALTDMTIGQMFATFGYLWFIVGSVSSILQIQYTFYSANGALERINNLLTLPQEQDHRRRINPFIVGKPISLELRNLVFGYDRKNPILRDFNLSLAAGEKVGIRGMSGCGKSTLVQVLLGLYRKQGGDILFGDTPVEKISYGTVRQHIATVLQHPAQLNATVRLNLALGEEYENEEFWRALRVAQLDETIKAMPNGLESIIGNRGVRLSGGQKQRLAIARVLLTRPCMLILDEATSALDEETEEVLHNSLRAHFKNMTVLIIAHRSSALAQADKVYTMEEGILVPQ